MPFKRNRNKADKEARKNPFLTAVDLDPEDFYIPSKDQDGDKSRIWAFIQPQHARQMQAYCAGQELPYKTIADIVRHAIRNQLAWLREIPLPIRSVWGQAELIIQISRDAEQQIKFEETFRSMSATVGRFMASNNQPEAKKYLCLCAEAIKGMPNGSWKDRFKDQFTSQFDVYLRATKMTGLIKTLDEPTTKIALLADYSKSD